MKLKSFLGYGMGVVILAFIATFCFILFQRIFFEQQISYIDNSLAAFTGAFVAFLFVRLAEIFDRIFRRKSKHSDALVKMERIGNEYQNLISDNLFIIEDFTDIVHRNIKSGQPFVYFNIA
jgi:uncharacterized membrane protein YdjX (TVP38/TMEM64 family)